MMDIKFRAWHVPTQRMFESNFAIDRNGDFIILDNPNFRYLASIDVIIMQYTGLKDKNGKEIYEGDITDRPKEKGNNISVVQFSEINLNKDDYGLYERALCWNLKYKDGSEIPLISSKEKAYGTLCTECKIIGNIYQTTKLLK